jgi:hypothetical protein
MGEVLYDISVVMAGIWFYTRIRQFYRDWKYHRYQKSYQPDDDPWNNY